MHVAMRNETICSAFDGPGVGYPRSAAGLAYAVPNRHTGGDSRLDGVQLVQGESISLAHSCLLPTSLPYSERPHHWRLYLHLMAQMPLQLLLMTSPCESTGGVACASQYMLAFQVYSIPSDRAWSAATAFRGLNSASRSVSSNVSPIERMWPRRRHCFSAHRPLPCPHFPVLVLGGRNKR
ncbi:hypothetical protein BD309DRAFT_72345 [Dichomitus squalens]|uniref:Uncharacterized protein n=1 Tax=Dichomitus squalens TaxID=114155 RepID=A0A4Q9PZZ5_9APHY|nr:hypothetical protein BD309DRAFT_72345 [Dichomitus squalens]TBU60437.1 hypothetical protein BD310DRAFT_922965 [Dichomitus squalens]